MLGWTFQEASCHESSRTTERAAMGAAAQGWQALTLRVRIGLPAPPERPRKRSLEGWASARCYATGARFAELGKQNLMGMLDG